MLTIEELVQEQHCCCDVENDKEPEEKTIILFAGFFLGLWGLLHLFSWKMLYDMLGNQLRQIHVDAGKNVSRPDSQHIAGEKITNLKRC